MDSLSSLNTSLPRSFPRRQPNADLHQAFKAAALSVAQLYKTAAADEDSARAAGYQDAIEELLSFLDQENLGLGDGEGWRVRQWATERLAPNTYGSDDDNSLDVENKKRQGLQHLRREKTMDEEVSPRTTSRSLPSQPPPRQSQQPLHPLAAEHYREPQAVPPQQNDIFEFRTPQDTDMEQSSPAHIPTPRTTPRRHMSQNQRDRIGNIALGNLGNGAGQKRKSPFADILDFADSSKDGSGGGPKRGRMA